MPARRKPSPAKGRASAAKAVKSAVARSDNRGDVMLGGIALAEIRRLIRLVQRTGIGELELSSNGRTLRISAVAGHSASVAVTAAAPPAGSAPTAPAAPAVAAPATDHHVAITSPMVGTFYRAPAPDADPYIEVGDMIDVGQTVCIVEAMKLMNEIESEVRGKVVKILVENAQSVEFGQRLFLVEPV
jgi:acetyl-CoA carboxylase biotin carboxyl carrier protein